MEVRRKRLTSSATTTVDGLDIELRSLRAVGASRWCALRVGGSVGTSDSHDGKSERLGEEHLDD
jgi:hypothetical protein